MQSRCAHFRPFSRKPSRDFVPDRPTAVRRRERSPQIWRRRSVVPRSCYSFAGRYPASRGGAPDPAKTLRRPKNSLPIPPTVPWRPAICSRSGDDASASLGSVTDPGDAAPLSGDAATDLPTALQRRAKSLCLSRRCSRFSRSCAEFRRRCSDVEVGGAATVLCRPASRRHRCTAGRRDRTALSYRHPEGERREPEGSGRGRRLIGAYFDSCSIQATRSFSPNSRSSGLSPFRDPPEAPADARGATARGSRIPSFFPRSACGPPTRPPLHDRGEAQEADDLAIGGVLQEADGGPVAIEAAQRRLPTEERLEDGLVEVVVPEIDRPCPRESLAQPGREGSGTGRPPSPGREVGDFLPRSPSFNRRSSRLHRREPGTSRARVPHFFRGSALLHQPKCPSSIAEVPYSSSRSALLRQRKCPTSAVEVPYFGSRSALLRSQKCLTSVAEVPYFGRRSTLLRSQKCPT